MKTNRRRFLSLLGVSTAAGPLAAKAALDEGIARQAGLNLSALATGGKWGYGSGGPPASSQGQISGQYFSHDEKIRLATAYIKSFGLPEFVQKTAREQSKWVNALDPDIAAKRTWSMSVKIQEQRARNYAYAIEQYENSAWYNEKKSFVNKLLGFEWPW